MRSARLARILWPLAAAPALADVVEYTDKEEWTAGAGVLVTIDFTGLPDNMLITDEYAELGVLFTDEDDYIACCGGFANDGAGLDGNAGIHLVFLTPQSSIAADYPGGVKFQLFSGGSLVHTSGDFFKPAPGEAGFAGLISSEMFDSAVLTTPSVDQATIDDLYFAGPTSRGDVDADGSVDVVDLLLLLECWGTCVEVPDPCPADVDHDGMVGDTDLLLLLDQWS